jgi:CubicO group peptidase (beta-lactamase class C family)
VIRKVSGKPWGDFLTERVFAPLGMNLDPSDHGRRHRPEPCPWLRLDGKQVSERSQLARCSSKRRIPFNHTRPGEMGAALLTDRILTSASKKQMWTAVTLNDGSKFPYGFGWFLNDWPANSRVPTGVPMIRHGGSMPGFRAGFARWPSHGLAVIVLTNGEGVDVDALAANIAIRVVPELKTQ